MTNKIGCRSKFCRRCGRCHKPKTGKSKSHHQQRSTTDVHPLSQNRQFTWRQEPQDLRDHLYQIPVDRAAKKVKLPTTVDLRPRCPAVYDQGNLGSCTANAADGAYHYNEIRKGQPNPPFLPARLFTYYNSRLLDGDPQVDNGSYCRTAMKTLKQYGVCPEALWPYVESQFAIAPSTGAYTDAFTKRIGAYQRVAQNLYSLQYTLAVTGQPIVFGFLVYSSFVSSQVARTGKVPMPNTRREQLLGGHAVLIVGYTKTSFIVRNSWGTGWGDKGCFYMPFAYVTNPSLASDFWIIA